MVGWAVPLETPLSAFVSTNGSTLWNHSNKKRKDSLETRAEQAVLWVYVENQAILEPIVLYPASKCKETKEQGSEDCLWPHIFTFLRDYYIGFFLFSTKMQI